MRFGENRGRHVVAGRSHLDLLTAGDKFGALCLAALYVGEVCLKLGRTHHRPHLRSLIERMANPDGPCTGNQALHEAGEDVPVNDKARRGCAFLATSAEGAVERMLDSQIDVTVIHDNESVL